MKEALTFNDIQLIPKYSEISSRSECNTTSQFTKNWKLKVPYISAPMDSVTGYKMAETLLHQGSCGIIHRFMSVEKQVEIVETLHAHRAINRHEGPIAAAVGASGDYLSRAIGLVKAGVDILLIDVAHGNTLLVKTAIQKLKKQFPQGIDIIAGNVATQEGALNLCEWGADAIRVGIGNGSLCETRIRTGIGVPQVTAILDCIAGSGVPIIADGGIRFTGDVGKAIGLGADTVMIGSLFAGTDEAPGELEKVGIFPDQKLFKQYRGSASLAVKRDHGLAENNIEGNSMLVPYKGPVTPIVIGIDDGFRSSMSYVGAKTIADFQMKAEFVRVTSNGTIEAQPFLMLK